MQGGKVNFRRYLLALAFGVALYPVFIWKGNQISGGLPVHLAALAASVFVALSIFLMFPLRRREIVILREPLSIKVIHDQSFADVPFAVFSEVWSKFAEMIGEDPRRLRPTDRMRHELRSTGPLDNSTENALLYFLEALDAKGVHREIEDIATLADLVRMVSQHSKDESPD